MLVLFLLVLILLVVGGVITLHGSALIVALVAIGLLLLVGVNYGPWRGPRV